MIAGSTDIIQITLRIAHDKLEQDPLIAEARRRGAIVSSLVTVPNKNSKYDTFETLSNLSSKTEIQDDTKPTKINKVVFGTNVNSENNNITVVNNSPAGLQEIEFRELIVKALHQLQIEGAFNTREFPLIVKTLVDYFITGEDGVSSSLSKFKFHGRGKGKLAQPLANIHYKIYPDRSIGRNYLSFCGRLFACFTEDIPQSYYSEKVPGVKEKSPCKTPLYVSMVRGGKYKQD